MSEAPRLIRLGAALWETTSLLLIDGPSAVAVDPCITPDEIEAVRARAAAEGSEVTAVLATHADWDHVCGIGAFPRATAAMGAEAARQVEGEATLARLREMGEQLGVEWERPRCDRVLQPNEATRVGPFVVEPVPLGGHTDTDLAYRVPALSLLCAGDYLSPIEEPLVYQSTGAYRQSLATLCDLLRRDPPETVAVGHGGLQTAAEALAVCERHLDYLWALRAAVADALAAGEGLDAARERAVAIGADVDGFSQGDRERNADRQIAELVPSAR